MAAIVLQAQMQSMVMTNATVVIGYCFGGSAVLDLAASWPAPATDDVLGGASYVSLVFKKGLCLGLSSCMPKLISAMHACGMRNITRLHYMYT